MRSFGTRLCIAIAMTLCLLPSHSFADRATARALTTEGQILEERGQFELALKHYERAIGSDPDYHQSYKLALPLWMRLQKFEAAQSRFEALTLRCEDCVFAWYALGALYRKGGRFDLAILAYETYLSKRPQDPDAHFGLAMALGASKDDKAAAVLRRYLHLENRPERRAFRAQAERLLREMGEEPAPERLEEPATDPLAEIAALVEEGHLVSAESLLNQRAVTGRQAFRLRARIARARGQWFQRAGFLALVWLWSK